MINYFRKFGYGALQDAANMVRSTLKSSIDDFLSKGYDTLYKLKSASTVVDISNPSRFKTICAKIWGYNPTIKDFRGIDASKFVKSTDEWVEYYRHFLSDNYIDEIPESFFVGKDKNAIKQQMALLRERLENTKKLALQENPPRYNQFGNPSFMNDWEIENCGEIWAAREAIFDGAKLEDLMFKSRYLNGPDNPFCDNCKITFEGLYELVN